MSDKMDKTVVVVLERLVKHPVYKKYIKRKKKYAIHDEQNSARTGDTVRFMEARPMSKSKRWRLIEIIDRAK